MWFERETRPPARRSHAFADLLLPEFVRSRDDLGQWKIGRGRAADTRGAAAGGPKARHM